MGQTQFGVLSETLRSRLKPGNPDHDNLAKLLNGRIPFKILGSFQPKGGTKKYQQITPLEGALQGKVLSVCEEHVVIQNPQVENPAPEVQEVRTQ